MIVLRRIYVALVVLMLTASLSCAVSEEMTEEYDTIVVGLGVAGSVAASTLARAGKKVLALEAQDRIGGRVKTEKFGDGVVEIGAEWIHGTEGSYVYNLGVENKIDIKPQDVQIKMIQSDGKEGDKKLDKLLDVWQYFECSDPEKPEPVSSVITKSLMDDINKNYPEVAQDKTLIKEIIRYVALMLENITAAYSWDDLNAQRSGGPLEGHQHMSWHRNGFETFFQLVLNTYNGGEGLPGLDIKLSTEVTKIVWPQEANGKVTVTTKDGSVYKAENVIVTLSVGVLQERYKDLFSPALPAQKATAIEKLQMGIISKTIFSFDKPWWPEKEFYYGLLWKDEDLKEVPEEDYWTTIFTGASTPMGSSNLVTMWSVGDVAKKIEVMPEEELKTKALAALRRFLGADIPEPTGMKRTKWLANEFTRGAYTYHSMKTADVPTAREDLGAPVNDASGKPRVLFAGEATHPTQFATVHGAADSGLGEAKRLLDL